MPKNMSINEITDANSYADPSWDYAQTYKACQKASQEMKLLLEIMSITDDASEEADASIKQHLDKIEEQLNSARQSLRSGDSL